MPAKPMVDGVELQQVQEVASAENEAFNQHQVPAMEGDLIQDLGRRATRINLAGVLSGPHAIKGVETLAGKFRAAAPVSFVADIATATRVRLMMVEKLGLRELAGKPQRFEYVLTLAEFIGPKETSSPAALPAPQLPDISKGNLLVQQLRVGGPTPTVRRSTVMVEGVTRNGQWLSRILDERSTGGWNAENLPVGQYMVKAASAEDQVAGFKPVTIRAAQTAHIVVPLQRGPTVARSFVVHFSAGKCFPEPAARAVLERAAGYARSHPEFRVLIAGHADAIGDAPNEHLLAGLRARLVYATLTAGRARDHLAAEWNAARELCSGNRRTIWHMREYQLILQSLGYFQGRVDGIPQSLRAALRDFQLDRGLPAHGRITDQTWRALIPRYMDPAPLAIPEARFLSARWANIGAARPAAKTRAAWRPNRRAEVLFIPVRSPDTDPVDWISIPAEAESMTVRGTIRLDDGHPAAGIEYVLIAPDGECMDGEQSAGAGRGQPIPGRAADGSFAYPDKLKTTGAYTLELTGPFAARLEGEPRSAARGAYVAKWLDGSVPFNIIVSQADGAPC